jgi:hypothetical protein
MGYFAKRRLECSLLFLLAFSPAGWKASSLFHGHGLIFMQEQGYNNLEDISDIFPRLITSAPWFSQFLFRYSISINYSITTSGSSNGYQRRLVSFFT